MNAATRRKSSSPRSEKAAYPGRTNPCRPTQARDLDRPSHPGADASYPPRCDPRKPRTPLSDEQRGLSVRYLPLARSLARQAAKNWPSSCDEFESAALLALVEAAQAFDPSRGVDFATFARFRIRGALSDVQRELFSGGWRGGTEFSPNFRPLKPNSEARGWVVGVQAEIPVGAGLETAETVENWLKKLPPMHSSAFRHIYLDGKTQEEAAVLVGCSKSSMSRLHRETITWFHQAGWSTASAPRGPGHDARTQPEPTATIPLKRARRGRDAASWSSRAPLGVAS